MKNEAKEIDEFTKKYFEMGISEIKTGIENGIYRSDINPVIIFVLNILIQDSTMNMSSDLRKMLNAHEPNFRLFKRIDSIFPLFLFVSLLVL